MVVVVDVVVVMIRGEKAEGLVKEKRLKVWGRNGQVEKERVCVGGDWKDM